MEGTCLLPVILVISSSSTFIVNYVIATLRGDIDAIFPYISACIVNYIIAVLRKDVVVIWPYISDTGATPPESCIFGLMTSITAMSGVGTMYARYKFIERLIEKTGGVRPLTNQIAFGVGLLSCFGMCVVATFQETVVTVVHDLGALLFFVTGVLYIVIQTYITYQAYPYGSSRAMCRTRAFITTIAVLALTPTVVCALLVKTTKLHWDRDETDYGFRLASAVCEWTVAFSFVFFFLTYIGEFKLFTLAVRAELVEHD